MPFSCFPVPFFPFFSFFISYVILGFESTGYAPREYIFSTNEFFSRGIEILESLTSRYHDATAAVHFVQAVRKKCPFSLSPFFSFCSRVRHLYTVKFKKDYIPRDSAASPSWVHLSPSEESRQPDARDRRPSLEKHGTLFEALGKSWKALPTFHYSNCTVPRVLFTDSVVAPIRSFSLSFSLCFLPLLSHRNRPD